MVLQKEGIKSVEILYFFNYCSYTIKDNHYGNNGDDYNDNID